MKVRIWKIYAVIVLLAFFFFIGKEGYDKHHGNQSTPKSTKITTSNKKTPVQPLDKASREKMHELLVDYNAVLSDTLHPIYEGCGTLSEYSVMIYVNPGYWHQLNKGEKEAIVAKAKNTYVGMLGARSIDVDDNFHGLNVYDKVTRKELASWGPIMGISISD